MAKKIAFFNHKGGVGKTTNAYHLGWMLAEKGKTVLFVDLDSQCNLTQISMGVEAFAAHYESQPEQNIKDLLTYAFESRPKVLEAAECIKVKNNDRLWLIPGSFEITQYEMQLAMSFQLYNSFSTMKHLPGSLHYLMEKTAKKYNADYIIIDTSSTLSAINQCILTSSDYFIIPTAPDYYSLMVMRTLSKIIPQWENWATQARTIFKEEVYPFPQTVPTFLGYIKTDYSIKKNTTLDNSENLPTVKQIFETITKSETESKLLSALRKINYYNGSDEEVELVSVPNFTALAALHIQEGLPVFKLDLENKRAGNQTYSAPYIQTKKQEFVKIYSDLADKILKLTEYAANDTTISAKHSRS